ncbi:uncharacterized protein C8Q71DRAFT_568716 [Rhodofomes roseus]|uniref:Uncharacterized protein n=1 Tax=Rhodofomes roseus TaxID=34475 RepID=A0ABQ8KIU7_9APHY|nr:uncharacterized protein C8Q71DRAFT_568716 [Rhodofomes roseus]KAH9837917.1 hypothetical protein C8Q71DRAFT_568716 [Rhodofomes roseus]
MQGFTMKRNLEALTIWAACTLLAASLFGKLTYLHWAKRIPSNVEPAVAREELTSALWDVERGPVHLQFDHYYLRYGLDAEQQWAALVPHDGLVYVGDGPNSEPYMPSMFHQLRCLDVLRAQYLLPLEERDMERAQHCINYIRQMVLCRGDMHLETFLADRWSPENVDRRGTYRCRDFRAVYDAVEKNQQEHRHWVVNKNTTA